LPLAILFRRKANQVRTGEKNSLENPAYSPRKKPGGDSTAERSIARVRLGRFPYRLSAAGFASSGFRYDDRGDLPERTAFLSTPNRTVVSTFRFPG
jgi:hypothetical protein